MLSLLFSLYNFLSSLYKRFIKQKPQKEVEEVQQLAVECKREVSTNNQVENTSTLFTEAPTISERDTANYTINLGTVKTPLGVNSIIEAFSQHLPENQMPTKEDL